MEGFWSDVRHSLRVNLAKDPVTMVVCVNTAWTYEAEVTGGEQSSQA